MPHHHQETACLFTVLLFDISKPDRCHSHPRAKTNKEADDLLDEFSSETPDQSTATVKLRLLHTTDLHANLRAYDYYDGHPVSDYGLSLTANLIRRARRENPNCLLFDGGDAFSGSPLGDLTADLPGISDSETGTHPVITAMNALGYDATTLGNHDFDIDHAGIIAQLSSAEFPVVSANLRWRRADGSGGAHVLAPYTTIRQSFVDQTGRSHGLSIAVTGCLPPETLLWQNRLSDVFVIDEMESTLRDLVPHLRAEGHDLIIVLAHSGIASEPGWVSPDNQILPISRIDGIDAIFGGHSHDAFPDDQANAPDEVDARTGLINGKPVVLSGFWGRHLGQIDLTLCQTANGWIVRDSRQSAHQIVQATDGGEDPAIDLATKRAHDLTVSYLGAQVTTISAPINSHFALLGDNRSLAPIAMAKETYARQHLVGTAFADLPLITSLAPFKTGQRAGPSHYVDIAAGPLSRRDVFGLYSYSNRICALRVTGQQLRAWVAQSGQMFHQLGTGAPDTQLIDPKFPGYMFDVFFGLEYSFDLSAPVDAPLHRLTTLAYQGAPIRDDDEFVVVTNSYRAHGQGGLAPPGCQSPAHIVFEHDRLVRNILEDELRTKGPPQGDDAAPLIWRFDPLGGYTVIFDTAPGGRAHLPRHLFSRIEDLGDTDQGFARFRLTL